MCSGWLRSTVRSGPSRKATTSPYSRLRRHTKPNMSREKASRWAPGKRARGPGGDGVETINNPSVEVPHLVRMWRPPRCGSIGSNPRGDRRCAHLVTITEVCRQQQGRVPGASAVQEGACEAAASTPLIHVLTQHAARTATPCAASRGNGGCTPLGEWCHIRWASARHTPCTATRLQASPPLLGHHGRSLQRREVLTAHVSSTFGGCVPPFTPVVAQAFEGLSQ